MLNYLGLLFSGKGLLAVKVRPIQSSFCSFSLDKKAHVFERACIVAKKGAKGPILGRYAPLKKGPLFRAPLTGPYLPLIIILFVP
jgi:hypothetical protein